MTRFLTPQELLQIAQTLPGDPACLDLGVLDAACARVQAHYMGRDVYASDWLKAAALMESIALFEPLEAKNEFFAWLVAETFLNTNNVTLAYEPGEVLALVMRAKHKGARVQEVAAQLRAWSTV
ncbi:type II toxin-antitoxin system death-on-curing family toxin [Streptomyces sp. AC550_RSS872]|uniref:type II toxin-antitoxin system death-on-curing family toxin n=1 Tax=Streptomyces sp. AC550_RSS872 TaxID=2823689 RepID=UPI001C268642|nr:fic family toxin-antitoxin system, toxin component [Streptomyces sp. AC550_RSS872]